MSKHFGGGRRLESKDYPPPRRGGVEDKRPSVFDRLGVRKYEDSAPSSHYGGSSGGDGGSYRRNDGPPGHAHRKHSPLPMMSGRRSQDARERMRSRSRSRSFSPRSRKVPSDIGHHGHGHSGHGHIGGHVPGPGPMRRPKMKEISPHIDHRVRRRSNSPMRRKLDKPGGVSGNSPKWRDEGLPPMSRQKGPVMNPGGSKKKGSGKKVGKKATKDKKSGIKGRSSSGSSGTTGGTSSSSRSASSSSSSSEASSSTTSNATSSSDSSVPSIKLKHDKQQKKKKMKRPASKSESASTGQIQSRISSGSSIESGNVRDNRDLREKIKAKTRQNYERMHDGTPSDVRQQRRGQDAYDSSSNRSYNKPDLRDESPGVNRRRRASGASSLFDDKPLKRRRVLSPEEFVPSPRRAPPNETQSGNHQPMRRERSPLQRDRMRVVQSPMRRAPVEDARRNDVRNDITKRLDTYGEKPRDVNVDRYRDDGSFNRDNMNRQKERLAPARLGNVRQHGNMNNQMPPDRDRAGNDRPGPGPINRFETRNRPLLQLPLTNTSVEQQKLPFRGSDERVLRTSLQPQSQSPLNTPTKHSPMIVKSKEALIEKYRGMKQSQYVDMWVDKTVEACSTPVVNVTSPPKDISPPVVARVFDDTAETGTKASSIKDIGELLSDFSDDADEILNDVGDDVKSEKSEKENSDETVKDGVAADVEQDAVSVDEAEASQAEKKVTPPVTTPTAPSVLSQDRKSLGTPQQSLLESREGQSLPSQSQTEDDILETMDFEEISDEEFGDVAGENKIPIVDALGVDWASLVCGEKNRPISPSSVMLASSTSLMKVRKRWTPIQVVSRVGLLNNCSENLLQKVVEMKMKEEPAATEGTSSLLETLELEEKIQDELQNAGKLRKRRARSNVIDTIGLGPNSRALSSRRDMALRRYYLGMPQKNLVSMDVLHQSSATAGVQDLDSIGELYRLSLSLFKGSDSAAVVV